MELLTINIINYMLYKDKQLSFLLFLSSKLIIQVCYLIIRVCRIIWFYDLFLRVPSDPNLRQLCNPHALFLEDHTSCYLVLTNNNLLMISVLFRGNILSTLSCPLCRRIIHTIIFYFLVPSQRNIGSSSKPLIVLHPISSLITLPHVYHP